MRFKRTLGVMVVTAIMTGLLAGPAAANKVPDKDPVPGGVKDSGVINAIAVVGKNRTGCANDGTSIVSGGGLGLPTQATKNAYWEIGNTGAVNDATSAFNLDVGDIKLCGRLDKVMSNVGGGIGAACGSSKGWDGKGTVTFPTKGVTIWVDKLGWKESVTTIVAIGQAVKAGSAAEAKAKKSTANDIIVAEVQTLGGGAGCANKADGTKPGSGPGSGATVFTVIGAYEVANGDYDAINPNNAPAGTCKGAPPCLYGPKKPGKSG